MWYAAAHALACACRPLMQRPRAIASWCSRAAIYCSTRTIASSFGWARVRAMHGYNHQAELRCFWSGGLQKVIRHDGGGGVGGHGVASATRRLRVCMRRDRHDHFYSSPAADVVRTYVRTFTYAYVFMHCRAIAIPLEGRAREDVRASDRVRDRPRPRRQSDRRSRQHFQNLELVNA